MKRITVDEMARTIAEAIAAQDIEIDNLGDGESVVLFNKQNESPVLNLNKLAEAIFEALANATKEN